MEFDKYLIGSLFEKALVSPRLRINQDLRTSELDGSQRMLNALLPGTVIPIHCHLKTSETVICLCGRMDEVFYDDNGSEIERIHLYPSESKFGCQVPKGVWHTIEVYEPGVIFEAKDCAHGDDGSKMFDDFKFQEANLETNANTFDDVKKKIVYVIGEARNEGFIGDVTPDYLSTKLNVPIEVIKTALKELEL